MEDQEKQVCLVTGGAGFIGSFLCEALLKAGKRVICVDDFSTGHVRNIDPYLRNPDFQFLKLDINEPFDLEQFPELEPFKVRFLGVQEVYHLAVPKSIKHFDQYRMQTLLTNTIGTRNILDIAVKYKAKFLLASSSVVYGNRTKDTHVFSEEYLGVVDHLTPRACYDEGKRFAETITSTYADVHKLDAKIARIFRTYGPRMPLFDGHQIPDFVMNALNSEDIIVNGVEDMKTSMLYVTDLVDGIIRLMHASPGIGPVNLGSDQDLKSADIARKVLEMTQSNAKVVFEAPLAFVTEAGLPDISKAKENLGWTPVVRLEAGLQKTIEYIRANKILLTNGD